MTKKFTNKKGTALITSLLVMGILTSVSIAISTLVVREIVITRLALDSAKAYYAAESGVEMALRDLKNNLPGWETPSDGTSVEVIGGSGEYSISNRADFYGGNGADCSGGGEVCSSFYPYFDPKEYDFKSFEDNPEALYGVLGLNESITVPLYTSGDEKIQKFVVQYYVDFGEVDLNFDLDGEISGWDILRWKIYGVTKDQTQATESINDFTGVTVISGGGGITTAKNPTWFGTGDDSGKCNNGGLSMITCLSYRSGAWNVEVLSSDDGQYIYDVRCAQNEAREYYRYDENGANVESCYPIGRFLEDHNRNYLTLTNFMNPAVFKTGSRAERIEKSKLYFRVVAYDNELVKEFADITSTGSSGDSEITLSVKKKRDSYLPVLNFALYHTADAPAQ